MTSNTKTNLLWLLAFAVVGAASSFGATQYGNVLILDNTTLPPTPSTANEGGLMYDSDDEVLVVSTTTGVGSEWVDQWGQGNAVGSKEVNSSTADAINAVGFQFTATTALTNTGGKQFSLDVNGGNSWFTDYLGKVVSQNILMMEFSTFAAVSLVTPITEWRGVLNTGPNEQITNLDFASLNPSVDGTGAADFTLVATHPNGSCTFTWPCVASGPTTVVGSGTCQVNSDAATEFVLDATLCDTPPTLYGTPFITYRIRSITE